MDEKPLLNRIIRRVMIPDHQNMLDNDFPQSNTLRENIDLQVQPASSRTLLLDEKLPKDETRVYYNRRVTTILDDSPVIERTKFEWSGEVNTLNAIQSLNFSYTKISLTVRSVYNKSMSSKQ